MPRTIPISSLNARSVDILNTIRANAPFEYQSLVPEITQAKDIPKVGEAVMGYPAVANYFLSALFNNIALTIITSKTYNNRYAHLKKGQLAYGETAYEVFIAMAKVRDFSPEKAHERELKRTLPDVKTAFHFINWRVQYPITIQQEDLNQAFLSADGVTNFIQKIIQSILTAYEYDETLLFKYMIIKAFSHGKIATYTVNLSEGLTEAGKAFRGVSNMMTFFRPDYNERGVLTITEKEDQHIFMDAMFNAEYDVALLAGLFNMEKADFMGKLELIDDFTTFDNERWAEIRRTTTMVEEVTQDELDAMKNVVAIIFDREWFQFYDVRANMKETNVNAGDYVNYFYNVYKTVSHSPFSNAVAFVKAETSLPAEITVEITSKVTGENATIITLGMQDDTVTSAPTEPLFVQTQAATEAGIAIHPYGAIIMPPNAPATTLELTLAGTTYTASATISPTVNVGATLTFTK